MIWENCHSYKDWETLLLLSLEVGFRHLHSNPYLYSRYLQHHLISFHAKHHQGVIDTILSSNNSQAVTDLAWASFMIDESGHLGLSICMNYVLDCYDRATEPFPPDLQTVFAFCVECVGLDALEKLGRERFVKSLNCLHIGTRDTSISSGSAWAELLLEITQSTEDTQHLAIQSWEFLAELALVGYSNNATYNPDVTTVTNWHFSRSFHFYVIRLTLVIAVQSLTSSTDSHSLLSISPSNFVSHPQV